MARTKSFFFPGLVLSVRQVDAARKKLTQMVSLYFLPSTSMTFTLKSTPMVAEISSGARKTPSTKRMSKLLFPVPLLPMRSSLSVATVSEDDEWDSDIAGSMK